MNARITPLAVWLSVASLLLVATPARAGGTGWLINEFLADPGPDVATGDANGDGQRDGSEDEFVEIVNATGSARDISGWTLSDGVGVRHTFPPGTVVEDSCAIVVFGGGSIGVEFTGAGFQLASSGMIGLNNNGDSITLADDTGLPVASVTYGGEGGQNQSLVLDPELDPAAGYVLHSTAPGSGGAPFSPGALADGTRFEGCPDTPPLPGDTGWIINEIHADPDATAGDANGDGVVDTQQDEFVEIYNDSGEDVDIGGWSVSDAVGVRHVFQSGTVIAAECAVVVFGGGSIGLEFTGATMQRASTGSLGFNNTGDTVTLSNAAGVAQAVATYGPEGGNDQSLTRDPDITGEAFVPHTSAAGSIGRFSPGTLSDGSTFAGCPDEPPPEIVVEIWEIQGPGMQSAFAGQVVKTRGNIVTAVKPAPSGGFFMQTPPERSDGDPETSDGLFVFTNGTPAVEPGDVVDVDGEVIEFFDLTEISGPDLVVVTAKGAPIPEPIRFDATVPSPDQPQPENELERFEGMLVEFSGTVTGPYNRFGELIVVARDSRAFREPGVAFPGIGGDLPVWDGNPEIFEVEPDFLGLPDAQLPAGASIDRCVGPLTFRFRAYTVLPAVLETTGEPAPRPVRERVDGELTVASLNLFALYDDQDDPGQDEVPSAGEYQRRLTKLALFIGAVLDAPDILAVQEVEKLRVLEDLAARVAAEFPGVEYAAFHEIGGDPLEQHLGYLVRDTVEVTSVAQIGADQALPGGEPTFSRPPLVLEAAHENGGASLPLTVINVHLRSLRDVDELTDAGDFAREKRLAQATFLAEEAQRRQTEDADVRLMIIGDFNAFEFTDGFVDVIGIVTGNLDPGGALLPGTDIVDPDLANQTLALPEAERYSFVRDGTAQALDHAVTSTALSELVSGVELGRGNADAPVTFEEDSASPLAASDHDGLVVFVRPGVDDGPRIIRADCNQDGVVNISDGIKGLGILFLGDPDPGCAASCDSNGSDTFDLADASYTFNFLFLGGPPPLAPFPECGATDGVLECATFPPCE